MILMLITIIFLLLMFSSGYRTGLVTTIARFALWALVFYIATVLSKPLASFISSWVSGQFARPSVPSSLAGDGTQFMSSGIAFVIIMAIGSYLGHFLLRSIHFVRRIPFLGKVDGVLGGLLSLILGLVIAFFLLQLLSVVPNAWLQGQFNENEYLNRFLDDFPMISNQIYHWWI